MWINPYGYRCRFPASTYEWLPDAPLDRSISK
jgi:hypothetical protein